MTGPYPASTSEAALSLFLSWFGAHYARSVSIEVSSETEGLLAGVALVGRRWRMAFAVADTVEPEATLAWEAGRAAIEQRLDVEGHSVAIWVPRGAPLPSAEPRLSEFVLALAEARTIADGRLELRLPVRVQLRRTSTTGSVVTVLGGLSAHWAQFTNRVPGSFQLNSGALFRLPSEPAERDALADRIILAAGQPDIDDGASIPAENAWTATADATRACVIGSPAPESDEQSAVLRRNLRAQLRAAAGVLDQPADARAIIVLGAATYAEEEKLSWAIRGMDPRLYAGYDLIAILADGVVKPLLQPGRSTLPWDAPPPGAG